MADIGQMDAVGRTQQATLIPEIIVSTGSGKAFQFVSQSAALAVQDPLALVERARQDHRLVHPQQPLIGQPELGVSAGPLRGGRCFRMVDEHGYPQPPG